MTFLARFLLLFGVLALLMGGMLSLVRQQTPKPAWIVFRSLKDSALYRANFDGSNQVKIASQVLSGEEQWLKDGDQIFFHTYHGLYHINNKGKIFQRVLPIDLHSFQVSPDENWIAFSTNLKGNIDIYLAKIDGTEQQKLIPEPTENTTFQFTAYSQNIIFDAYHEGKWSIQTINLNNFAINNLTPSFDNIAGFQLSTDKNWAIFIGERDGSIAIYKMKTDGSDVQSILPIMNIVHSLRISPTAEWVAFIVNEDDGSAIYKMKLDGSQIQRISDYFDGFLELEWSYDGHSLIFTTFQGIGYNVRPNKQLSADGSSEKDISPEETLFLTQAKPSPIIDYDWESESVFLGGLACIAFGVLWRRVRL